jgi:hypothetical protein
MLLFSCETISMTEQTKLVEFRGVLTFDVIGQLLSELKRNMKELDEKVNTYKRLLIISVETLENICKYTEHLTPDINVENEFPSIFALVKENENYLITAGNLISSKDQESLKERIDKVNRLNHIELKKVYRQIISNGSFNKFGGAGLGFIEIAKSAGRKIEYHFKPVNNTMAFFTINLEITSQ